MPDRHLTVFGQVLVSDVTSVAGKERHQKRIAKCEVGLFDESEAPLLIDIHYWGDRPKHPSSIALVLGDIYLPPKGEPVIFADIFAVTGQYTEDDKASLPLYVVAVGVIKGVDGLDTVLETEVYHRENRECETFDVILRRPSNNLRFSKVPTPTIGSVYLARGVLADFDKLERKGVAIINIEQVAFFSFKPAIGAAKLANGTPGKGKRKLERTESSGSTSSVTPSSITPSPKKPKVELPPFSAPKSGSDDK
ncbi:hypothetical protein FRC10_000766 [Ceratobasidium sp. 414]|nr:hypothetical protein FRC10_000766 [Ceratobasidium sp. 414]